MLCGIFVISCKKIVYKETTPNVKRLLTKRLHPK